MRRRSGCVLAALLALTLLVVPTVALAEDAAPDVVLLAAEEGGDLGPEPMPRDAEDNPARTEAGYEDQETPFTWGAAWILTFAGLAGLVLLVGIYLLRVREPSQRVRH